MQQLSFWGHGWIAAARRRRRALVAVAVTLCVSVAGGLWLARGPSPRWVDGGLDRALEVARAEGKPVLILVTGDW